jgi:hypothetical protein
MAPIDVYTKALAVVETWNGAGTVSGPGEIIAKWFPDTLFAGDCMLTSNNAPPGDLREAMTAYALKPFFGKWTIESISTAPGAWAHFKVQTTYTDAADHNNAFSYPQFYTLCFNDEGKVNHFIILNDPRDLGSLVEGLIP